VIFFLLWSLNTLCNRRSKSIIPFTLSIHEGSRWWSTACFFLYYNLCPSLQNILCHSIELLVFPLTEGQILTRSSFLFLFYCLFGAYLKVLSIRIETCLFSGMLQFLEFIKIYGKGGKLFWALES
jgi:hypothetical protein